MIEQKMKQNLMIGTAILSEYSAKKNQDTIDLMIPFIKYTLIEKYNIGDTIDIDVVNDYIQEYFGFTELPKAIILKAVRRLSKNKGCLAYNGSMYIFKDNVSAEHDKMKAKKEKAVGLIDAICDEFLKFLAEMPIFKKYTLEDAKSLLLSFLDKYGLFTYEKKLQTVSLPKDEAGYRWVGKFILKENEKQSKVFENLIELVKGIFVSKAIYMQNGNDNLFKAKMKDTVLILDAPLMLKILGLKSRGENKVGKELLGLVPPQAKLRYLPDNFNELEYIIKSFINKRTQGETQGQTLEFFEEANYKIDDVRDYLAQLEKKLKDRNIYEYEDDIPIPKNYFIDEKGLFDFLKEKISGYTNKELALKTDIKSISVVERLRNGKKTRELEKCKAIFLTNNNNLAYWSNSFINEQEYIGHVITDVDFTVLMWLKNSKINSSLPKDMLVANAYAATEEITDIFMNEVMQKILLFKQDPDFNEENSGSILEDIYIRRELVEICDGNADNLTKEKLISLQEKYENKIANKMGYKNTELINQLNQTSQSLKTQQEENDNLKNKVMNKAKNKAKKFSNFLSVFLYILIYGIISFITCVGIYGTIKAAIADKLDVLSIVLLLISVLSIVDLFVTKFKFVSKLIKFIKNKVYYYVENKETEILQDRM